MRNRLVELMHELHEKHPYSPSNIGELFVLSYLINNEAINYNAVLNTPRVGWTKADYFMELFCQVARTVELNELFFSKDVTNTMRLALSGLVSRLLAGTFSPNPMYLAATVARLELWLTGMCYDYAIFSMHYLLEAGIRPVDLLWLNQDNSKLGHAILAVGLDSNHDFQDLAQTDAYVFDFWSGTIYPAKEIVTRNEQSIASIEQLFRVERAQENPLCFPDVPASEKVIASKFCDDIATNMLSILNKRAESEPIITYDHQKWQQIADEKASEISPDKRRNQLFALKKELVATRFETVFFKKRSEIDGSNRKDEPDSTHHNSK